MGHIGKNQEPRLRGEGSVIYMGEIREANVLTADIRGKGQTAIKEPRLPKESVRPAQNRVEKCSRVELDLRQVEPASLDILDPVKLDPCLAPDSSAASGVSDNNDVLELSNAVGLSNPIDSGLLPVVDGKPDNVLSATQESLMINDNLNLESSLFIFSDDQSNQFIQVLKTFS